MTSNLCRWGVDHSIVMQLVKMRGGTQYNIHLLCSLCRWRQTFADEGWNTVQLCNLYKWGVKHSTTFICYATCANEVELVKMRGGKWYNSHLLCNLCRWGQTCANEGWNTAQLHTLCKWGQTYTNVGGVEHSTIFICYAACVETSNLWRWGVEQYSYATCTNEGWNTVQYSFVMQLVQMKSNLCRWGLIHTVKLRVQH